MVNKAAAWKMYLDRGNDEPFWLNGVLVIPSKWGSSMDDNGLKSPQVKFLCSNPNCNGRLFGLYSARHYCKKEDNGVPTGSADDPPPPLPPPPPPAQKKKSSKSPSDKKNPPKTSAAKKNGGNAKKAAPKKKSAPKELKRGGKGSKKRGGGKKDDEGGTGNKVQRLATAAAGDPELYAQYKVEEKAQRAIHKLSSDSNRRFSFPSYDVWKTLPRE